MFISIYRARCLGMALVSNPRDYLIRKREQ